MHAEKEGLTPRQLEVLKLVAGGATDRLVAYQLHCSSATTKHHLRAIYEKLGATCRVQAVVIAMKKGWIN